MENDPTDETKLTNIHTDVSGSTYFSFLVRDTTMRHFPASGRLGELFHVASFRDISSNSLVNSLPEISLKRRPYMPYHRMEIWMSSRVRKTPNQFATVPTLAACCHTAQSSTHEYRLDFLYGLEPNHHLSNFWRLTVSSDDSCVCVAREPTVILIPLACAAVSP